MTDAAKREACYEDLYGIPEHTTGEIIDGELFVRPRPGGPHIDVAAMLGGELIPPFRFGRGGPGGWLIYHEPELHLGKNVIVPDLAGWRRERLPGPPDDHRFTLRPDWICEILSPSTARIDRIRKMPIFARYEVPYAWLVDPVLKTIEVFRLQSGNWVIRGLYSEDEKIRAEPFDELEIDLTELWP